MQTRGHQATDFPFIKQLCVCVQVGVCACWCGGSAGLMSWKQPSYQKKPTDSLKFSSKLQHSSSQKLRDILNFILKHTFTNGISETILKKKNCWRY